MKKATCSLSILVLSIVDECKEVSLFLSSNWCFSFHGFKTGATPSVFPLVVVFYSYLVFFFMYELFVNDYSFV